MAKESFSLCSYIHGVIVGCVHVNVISTNDDSLYTITDACSIFFLPAPTLFIHLFCPLSILNPTWEIAWEGIQPQGKMKNKGEVEELMGWREWEHLRRQMKRRREGLWGLKWWWREKNWSKLWTVIRVTIIWRNLLWRNWWLPWSWGAQGSMKLEQMIITTGAAVAVGGQLWKAFLRIIDENVIISYNP